jgi:hypothetical protein
MAGIAPLTPWDKAKEYIDEGTVESLGALGRSEEQLVMYRSFMDKVRRNAPYRPADLFLLPIRKLIL